MPRVLMLARHFPPIGGAGVHRSVGTVRHLHEHGFEPVVVTGPAQRSRNRWEPRDPGLVDRIPATVKVHRLPEEEPTAPPRRLEKLLDIPAPWARWWVAESARLGTEVGRDADVVLASCVPYETAFAGARVARELGIPWIADLEDPWALDEMRVPLSAAHKALDMRRMRRALATASAIVMAAPEAAERVKRAMPELACRIVVKGIEIGYEAADFEGVNALAPDGTFRIVHTGSMHTDLGLYLRHSRRQRLLGGAVKGLDPLTRSHVFLVDAIADAVRADSSLGGRVELHLAGELTDADRRVIDGHDFVHEPGLLSHTETVSLMRSADLLFLPMQNLPTGMRAGLIPYKTFEYLAAARPILAAVPDGDVRDMLAPLPQATVVRPADVGAMSAVVRERAAAAAAAGGREADVSPPPQYERRRSVERIAGVLDTVLGGAGVLSDRPGPVSVGVDRTAT